MLPVILTLPQLPVRYQALLTSLHNSARACMPAACGYCCDLLQPAWQGCHKTILLSASIFGTKRMH